MKVSKQSSYVLTANLNANVLRTFIRFKTANIFVWYTFPVTEVRSTFSL